MEKLRAHKAVHDETQLQCHICDKLLKNYKSCEFAPIKLSSHLQDAEILYSLPPDPIHTNLLGAGNDACECLEKHFPAEMFNFYAYNPLKKNGQGPGGKFDGPSIKFILREEILCQLENLLPVNASSFISYLRSLSNLH